MLIFEAKHQIDERIETYDNGDLKGSCDEYVDALRIASASMQKQMDLIDLLNDWDIETGEARGDRYSARLCHDIVRQFSIYADEVEEDAADDNI